VLHPDDLVVLYSDGLSEARRESSPDEKATSEIFGQDRVARLIRNDPTQPAQQLCQVLLDEAQKFARGRINDDLAIFAVRWTGIVSNGVSRGPSSGTVNGGAVNGGTVNGAAEAGSASQTAHLSASQET